MTTVGIIGAGQLGQMLGFAGRRMGLEFVFLDPAKDPPASAAGRVISLPFDSEQGLQQLAAASDIITYEFENVPVESIDKIASTCTVYPPAEALSHAQDRLAEKKLFDSLDIPVPGYRTIDSADDLHNAVSELGYPLVVKTRRLGYDGKGQVVMREPSDIDKVLSEIGHEGLIAEQFVSFDREVSAIGARSVSGEIAVWPITENVHSGGILSVSRAPAEADKLEGPATEYLTRLMNRLDYVGVLALELFVVGDSLLANEFAPRVHNSGHWTIEGAITSQFENHLRAILDMPLGDTAMRGYAGMLNLIGTIPDDREALAADDCYLHDYGKAPRPGRKLGHVTIVAENAAGRESCLERLAKLLKNQLK